MKAAPRVGTGSRWLGGDPTRRPLSTVWSTCICGPRQRWCCSLSFLVPDQVLCPEHQGWIDAEGPSD